MKRLLERSFPIIVIAVAVAVSTAQVPSASQREIENVAAFARLFGVARYFYPSDAAAALDWNRFAVYGVGRVRAAQDSAVLEATLEELFTPLGPNIEIATLLQPADALGPVDSSLVAWRYEGPGIGSPNNGPYRAGRSNRGIASSNGNVFRIAPSVPPARRGDHVDIDLSPQLKARVPLSLTGEEARTGTPHIAMLRAAVDAVEDPSGRSDLDVRLADTVAAWNVYRHFYPYWSEAEVDWDGLLAVHIANAYSAGSRDAYWRALQLLVADARDGHGLVMDRGGPPLGALPVALRIIEGQLVVTASAIRDIPLGAVVTAVNGVAASERIVQEMKLASGTMQWKQTLAARRIAACERGTAVNVTFTLGTGPAREFETSCDPQQARAEKRPESMTEIAPGIWYVDLTRTTQEQATPMLPKLASAAGIVFDLRGYPTNIGYWILPYLITTANNDSWMHVANIVGPFGSISGWQSFGWRLTPASPHLGGRRVFLTDARAISYSESVMGHVADLKLATIIGSTTAGTNGNVVTFTVPSGFAIRFTGMLVTGHDGRAQHHLIGVKPDIPLEPTIAGIRAGRDELLERALTVLRQ
jgi:hypothetical protein